MKYINYIHSNIRKIFVIYLFFGLTFIAWVIFSVMRDAKVAEDTKIPSYSLSEIDSINHRLEKRRTIETEKQIEFSDSDYGKEEPFR